MQTADSSTSVVAGLSHERPHGTTPAFSEPVHDDVDEVVDADAVELPLEEVVDEDEVDDVSDLQHFPLVIVREAHCESLPDTGVSALPQASLHVPSPPVPQ